MNLPVDDLATVKEAAVIRFSQECGFYIEGKPRLVRRLDGALCLVAYGDFLCERLMFPALRHVSAEALEAMTLIYRHTAGEAPDLLAFGRR